MGKNKIRTKLMAIMLATTCIIEILGNRVYAADVVVENFTGDLTIEELKEYYQNIGAEDVKFEDNKDLSVFLMEDRQNMIESYEFMEKEEKSLPIIKNIKNRITSLKGELANYSLDNSASTFATGSLPSRYDITTDSSTSKYFPNIMSQGSDKGSCQFFSMYYYMFSYEANKLNNISSKTLANCYSPEWGYIQYFNNRKGIEESLKNFGAVRWNECTYSTSSDQKLSCVTEDALLEALKTRLDSYRTIAIPFGNSPIVNGQHDTLTTIKQILNAKKPIYGKCCTNWLEMKTNSSNETIVTRMGYINGTHAVTIVGYDDNIWCDVNQNGVKDSGETGALKIANSWGTSKGNNGYYWILYDALNGQSQIKGFNESKYTTAPRYPAFLDYLEVFNVRAHRPMVIAKLDFEGWNPDKTSVSWGVSSIDNKLDNGINLINKETVPLSTVRLYDYADEADTVNELIGNKSFFIRISNRNSSDQSKYYSKIRYRLMDSNKTTIQSNSGSIISNRTIKFNTALKLGDVDYNKTVTNADAQTVLNIALGSKKDASNLQLLLSDYNKDGKVDLKDARAVNSIKQ